MFAHIIETMGHEKKQENIDNQGGGVNRNTLRDDRGLYLAKTEIATINLFKSRRKGCT